MNEDEYLKREIKREKLRKLRRERKEWERQKNTEYIESRGEDLKAMGSFGKEGLKKGFSAAGSFHDKLLAWSKRGKKKSNKLFQ